MNFLDLAIVLIIAASAALGALSGLTRAALNLAAIAAACYVCYVWGGEVGALLFPGGGSWATGGGYAIAFFAPLIALSAGAVLVRRLLRLAGLGGWDSAGGMVFGAARGALFVGALIVPLAFTPLAESALWNRSATLPYFGRALAAAADSSPRLAALYNYIGLDAADRPRASALVLLRDAALAARAQEVDPQEVLDKLRRAQNAEIGSNLADEEEIINSYKKFVPFGEKASPTDQAEAMQKLRELNPESAAMLEAYLEKVAAHSRGAE